MLDGYGNDAIPHAIKDFKADIVFTLIDLWVMDTNTGRHGAMFCPLFPVDHDPVPQVVADRFPHADRLITYAQYGERKVKEYQNGRYAHKVLYIPHMVDCKAYYPATIEEKMRFRKRLYPDWPEDAFIVGMVAANKGFPSRKSFPEALEAFAMFAHDYPEARLYLHSYPNTEFGGPNLVEMAGHFGIQDKVHVVNPGMMLAGDYGDELMRQIYTSMDVLLSPSQGEGFCTLPTTLVRHSRGYKAIKQLAVGMKVLSHDGQYHRVTRTMRRWFKGDMCVLKAHKFSSAIKVTPEHPILTKRGWLNASDITVDDWVFAATPPLDNKAKQASIQAAGWLYDRRKVDGQITVTGKNQYGTEFIHPNATKIPNKLQVTDDLLALVGAYIAEGCGGAEAIFCLSADEPRYEQRIRDAMQNVFGLNGATRKETEKKRVTLVYSSILVAQLLQRMCGHRAENKHLPSWIWRLAPAKVKRLLTAMWLGDGTLRGVREYSTVSQQLALQTRDALHAVGVISGCYPIKGRGYKVQIANGDRKADWLGIAQIPSRKLRPRFYQKGETGTWLKLSSVEREPYNGWVCNLEVDGTNSYMTESFVVHNCVPLIESQACGTPIVVTDFSAMSELVGAGWRVPPLRLISTLLWAKQAEADVQGIYHALKEARWHLPNKHMSAMAREFALRYDVPTVVETYWAPFLASLDAGRMDMTRELREPIGGVI